MFGSLIFKLRHFHAKSKRAAFASAVRSDLDAPVAALEDFLDDLKTHTFTSRLRLFPSRSFAQLAEELGQLLKGNPNTGISHTNIEGLALLCITNREID